MRSVFRAYERGVRELVGWLVGVGLEKTPEHRD